MYNIIILRTELSRNGFSEGQRNKRDHGYGNHLLKVQIIYQYDIHKS